MTLVFSRMKAYSISMKKRILSLASRIGKAFIHEIEQDIRKDQMRTVCVQEKMIGLSEEEASFIAAETNRILRSQRQEAKRKRKLGIPLAIPGNTAYAVYM